MRKKDSHSVDFTRSLWICQLSQNSQTQRSPFFLDSRAVLKQVALKLVQLRPCKPTNHELSLQAPAAVSDSRCELRLRCNKSLQLGHLRGEWWKWGDTGKVTPPSHCIHSNLMVCLVSAPCAVMYDVYQKKKKSLIFTCPPQLLTSLATEKPSVDYQTQDAAFSLI